MQGEGRKDRIPDANIPKIIEDFIAKQETSEINLANFNIFLNSNLGNFRCLSQMGYKIIYTETIIMYHVSHQITRELSSPTF